MLHAGQSLKQFEKQIIGNDKQLKALSASGQSVIASMRGADGASKGFLGTMRDLSIVTGALSMGMAKVISISNGWVGDIVRVNAEMERLRFQMQGMSTAADPIQDAASSVNYLRESAMQMPFSLKSITNAFVKLKATGTDPMAGSLKAIADGVAAFGGTDESFNRIVLGIQQMSGKGVIQMEEMRQQLAEAMPRAMELMARGMGVSMGDLVREIGTGTVEAKSALDAFYKEIERTFGGRAEYMMQSFSGQVSKLYTSLQVLATGEGGFSFFNQVKEQLIDLNDFLASDAAKVIATDFGQALNSVIYSFREVIGFVVEFRSEIMNVGKALAVVFAATAISRGISSMAVGLAGISRAMIEVRAQTALAFQSTAIRTFSTSMTVASTTMTLGASAMGTLGTAAQGAKISLLGVSAAASATRAAAAALIPIVAAAGRALAVMLPWVSAVGLAAYAAAEYFGVFSDKTTEAYEALVKYGAETRKQAEDIVTAKEDQLAAEIEIAKKRIQLQEDLSKAMSESSAVTFGFGMSAGMVANEASEAKKALAKAEEELGDLKKRRGGLIRDAERREQEAAKRQIERDFEDRRAILQREYDREQIDLGKNLVEQRKINIAAGKSIREIDEKYHKDLTASRLKLAEGITRILEDQLAKNKKIREEGNEDERRAAEAQRAFLEERLAQSYQTQAEAQKAMYGVSKLDKAPDTNKAFERGEKLISSLSDDVTGLKSKLSGASSAYAEMQQRISRGDFSTVADGGEKVRKLHEDLLRLARDKELFDKLVKGQEKAETDIENARIKLLEEEMELKAKLQGRDLTEGERLKLRLDEGYYDGLGPIENIKKALGDVITTFDAQKEVAGEVGQKLRHDTFGDETVNRVDDVTKAVGRLKDAVNGVDGALSPESFTRFGNGVINRLRGFFQSPNFTPAPDINGYGQSRAPEPASEITPIPPTVGEARQRYNDLLEDGIKRTQRLAEETEELTDRENETNKPLRDQVARNDYLTNLREQVKNASDDVTDLDRNYRSLVKSISQGKFGENRDAASPEYREMIAAARQLDGIERSVAQNRKARNEVERQVKDIEAQRVEINRQIAEAKARAANPDYQPRSSDYQRLNEELTVYLRNVKQLYGEDSQAYRDALATRDSMLKSQLELEVRDKAAVMARENRDIEDSLLTQTELRQRQYERNLEILDDWVEMAREAGMDEVEITKIVEERKAALRKKLADDADPVAKKMREWKDIQTQIGEMSSRWMDGLADGVTDVLMGTGDLRSMVNGMLRDMINMAVKYGMSNMSAKGGQAAKGASSGKAASAGGKAAGAAMFHTGGIAGAPPPDFRPLVPMSVFANAPRFHKGGIAGGLNLRQDEIPAILQKNEGVFTPEQMAALGGFSQSNVVNISTPVTVNANGGSPEQNEDLAKRVAKHLEASQRALVVSEVQKQMRPGNMLNTKVR